jgi:hypothetical protein
MKLPPWLLARLRRRILKHSNRAPDFIIGGTERPYMRRWFVIPRNNFFNIYLHQILRSDDDRALHDHPWVNCSILLNGRYVEHTISSGGINRRKEYRAGDIKFRGARSAHRLELVDGQCWSLFITGPRLREWGFHCVDKGWVHWREFTAPHDTGQIGRGCD